MTAARKQGGDGSGHFLSISDMNDIRHAQEIDNAQTKRRQAEFNKSSRRRKDGTPYQAHRQLDNWKN